MDELIKQLLSYAKWAEKRPLEIPILLPVYLRQAADELEKRRWIPVEERLPEPGEKVLALWGAGSGAALDFAYFMDGSMGERWRYKNWVAPPDAITHWMPLPAPPKGDKT